MRTSQRKRYKKRISKAEFHAAEKALKYVFDIKKDKWTQSAILVQIDEHEFEEGGMRRAFFMKDLSANDTLVAKRYYDDETGGLDGDYGLPEDYFNDVILQAEAQRWADRYNSLSPPKEVAFVPAFVIRLVDRPDKPYYACEALLKGEFTKHNANNGWVDADRHTPQAFSHFTYEASKKRLMVVDIQGVDDVFTDPQIHSVDPDLFGVGNLGVEGMLNFFETHQCNPICRYLGLSGASGTTVVEYGDTLVPGMTRAARLSSLERRKRQRRREGGTTAAARVANLPISRSSGSSSSGSSSASTTGTSSSAAVSVPSAAAMPSVVARVMANDKKGKGKRKKRRQTGSGASSSTSSTSLSSSASLSSVSTEEPIAGRASTGKKAKKGKRRKQQAKASSASKKTKQKRGRKKKGKKKATESNRHKATDGYGTSGGSDGVGPSSKRRKAGKEKARKNKNKNKNKKKRRRGAAADKENTTTAADSPGYKVVPVRKRVKRSKNRRGAVKEAN